MLQTFATMLAVVSMTPVLHAQPWGVWQPEPDLPTGGEAKTHAIGLELNGSMFVLGGPPWMNPPNEDGTVYSRPMGGGPWTEEIGFDGYGFVLGQGGGVDDMGRIIIFGGDDPDDPGGFDKPPFEWNQIEGPWHEHADRGVSAPASNFAFCTDDDARIYSIGGGPGEGASIGNPNSAYCERFIGSLDTWETIAPMPFGLANAAATPDGIGHILVFGGISPDGSSRTNEVLRYDIATNTWSSNANANMPVALSDHQATLGADGRVYILGGSSGPIGAETVERAVHVYNPLTDQWAVGPDMSEPRRHFASFTGSDDRVYVLGGDNSTGGSFGVESIYTTPCPVFVTQPESVELWQNTTIGLSVQTTGGGTITYQWMHDGNPLSDGPSAGGGVISGALTGTLSVESTGPADAGVYTVVASNACGDTTSTAAVGTVLVPPEIPQQWTWTSLHPSYAEASYAQGVDDGVQVGRAIFDTPDYNNIDHPTRWAGTAASAQNLTPNGSQGGSILDFAGDKLVGWWWEPIQCYVNHQWQTCYFRRACWWNLDGTFHSTSYSGFEYTLMSATDGTSVVGSGATDDDVGNVFNRAVIWQAPTHEFAQSIHPAGFPDSAASAVDGDYQYGNVSLPF
ncbi:MAG: immunoglobulin domain-containing protein, partial [Phycisphaerales bacterium]|nr:immunoglobulin domain-containing protein [Phycisphaerales bacterium]